MTPPFLQTMNGENSINLDKWYLLKISIAYIIITIIAIIVIFRTTKCAFGTAIVTGIAIVPANVTTWIVTASLFLY